MTTTAIETTEVSERQIKLIEEVKEIDRLRDENLSKEGTLRATIHDGLKGLETEFSNLTQQRQLKEEAFRQLEERQGSDVAVGSAVKIKVHRQGYPYFLVGVVKETWHNYAMVTLEPESDLYDDCDGEWTGPAHYLSVAEEDHTEKLTMPDDPHCDEVF
jgi:hypothetical protein